MQQRAAAGPGELEASGVPWVRAADREVLARFTATAAVAGGALLVLGDPGSGKSTLLERTAAAPPPGGTVLRTAGTEFEADLPFSALDVLMRPVRDRLAALSAPHRTALSVALGLTGGPPPGRAEVAAAVLEVWQACARSGPVLVVVDDLQWVDDGTAAVLGALVPRLAGTRIGLLAAQRPGAAGAFDRADVTVHELAPLGGREAAALVRAAHPEGAPRVLDALLDAAQGNPLVLQELPRALTAEQLRGEQELPAVLPLGPRLERLFAERVQGVPPAAAEVLLLAALEATDDPAGLAAAAGRDVAGDLAALEQARLLQRDRGSGAWRFRHPLVRSTVLALSTAAARADGHQRWAGVVGDLERRVRHLAAAAPGPDEQVAAAVEQAAHRVLGRGDRTGAMAALLRAAELTPDPRRRTQRLAQAAYFGLARAAERRTAVELLAEARRSDPELAGSLGLALTAALVLLTGADCDIETGHALIVRTIEARGGSLDAADAELVGTVAHLADLSADGHRQHLWDGYQRIATRIRPSLPPELQVFPVVLRDPVRAPDEVLAALDGEIDALTPATDPVHLFRVAQAAFHADRSVRCLDALSRLVADSRDGEDGIVAPAFAGASFAGWTRFAVGEWDQALDDAGYALLLAGRLGFAGPEWLPRMTLAAVAAGRGDHARARAEADRVLGWATSRRSGSARQFARHVGSLSAMGRRDHEEAYRECCAATPPGSVPALPARFGWFVLDLVESAVRTGRHAEAAAHARAAREVGLARLSPRAAMTVAAAEALTAPDGRAAELFETAVAVPGAQRWAFEHARVRLLAGEHLRRQRSTAGARAHLLAASAVFQRLGAVPWAERAAGELRASGVDPAGAQPPLSPLTPQEREVAELAASGLTNRQIAERLSLSPRTVGAHLYHAFPKLGVSSRAALRDALSAGGGTAAGQAGGPSAAG